MNATAAPEGDSSCVLFISFALACLLLLALVKVLSLDVRNMARLPSAPPAPVPLEAEFLEQPLKSEPQLKEEAPVAKRVAAPTREPVISTRPDVGKTVPEGAVPADDEKNRTVSGPPIAPSHGPIVLDAPTPKLPSYLRDQSMKSSVLIEFTVREDGASEPHLVGSSGNEEVDAIALRTAKQWHFQPAIQQNKPVASKVKLRINFQVD